MRYKLLVFLVSAAWALGAISVQAETIAYWSMEYGSGALASDFSGNNYDGYVKGSEGSCFQWTSGICDPVPGTGAQNQYGLQLLAGSGYVTLHDKNDFYQSSAFTIEVMFQPTAANPQGVLAGQWDPDNSWNRQWQLRIHDPGVDDSYAVLDVRDDDGTQTSVSFGRFPIEQNGKYCLVAQYIDLGESMGKIQFYGRTACSGEWTTWSETFGGFQTLENSTANFMMGRDADGGNNFLGVLDEVRYSSGAIDKSKFLCNPEPATTSLALLAAGMGAFSAWRRKKRALSAEDAE